MDKIKEAFQKVREDIIGLYRDINSLKDELRKTREEMLKLCEIMKHINENINKEVQKTNETQKEIPANQHINLTYPRDSPTHNSFLEALKGENKPFSTGNEGVPTDRQTDQQTDNTWQNQPKIPHFLRKELPKTPKENPIEDAVKILDSLDDLRKEIRLKFKQLTDQEILVFSTIYQLEEEGSPVDYKALAEKLKLTESSIRDYIGRLLKKGIPVDKKKINNKQINLSISQSLKKIASLSTILQLRDI